MASSSGTSPEGVAQEERKRKRMLSNRESARRSRQRKQKRLDELTETEGRLRKENAQIKAALGVTTRHYLGVEAENSVLRTQAAELGSRLQALNEILSCCSIMSSSSEENEEMMMMMMRPWSFVSQQQQQQQPIMAASAAVDMYQY